MAFNFNWFTKLQFLMELVILFNRAFIGFVQIKDAFHWNHDEKQSVQLIFLIGVPQDNQNNIHL